MCPDKKLQWFEEHSYDSEGIEEVYKPPTDCWNELYKPEEGIHEVATTTTVPWNIHTKVN